ncbi:spermidine synthase [Streptomyces sp. N2-109]|uniref:Polyamine aminopropyltransferase n=1 Tax=Streptomyces gossypii TaxID=2883101 RepID=A0ABT2JPB5_9ACTN|nr:spermidine synthase [Streptomyces gossypii]MCT2589710.1 spermidine synthase [Streptomyces gossypii]
MIDRPFSPARLPVPAGIGRAAVLVSVFVCAACGLVYELELVALAAYLVGDSVTQASVVLSVMVFAMGLGSLLAKRLRCHAAVGFGVIEAVLALIGGGSAMALYATFAWFGESRWALIVFSIAIGMLIGAEMPLLMTLIQRIRAQDPGVAVADLFAADYVGALLGGLTFPFLLLPFFGQLTGVLLTGVVNAVAGGVVVLWLFRRDLSTRGRWSLLAVNGGVVALLLIGTAFVASFERAAREAMYGEDVRVAMRTETQEIVLTGGIPTPRAADGHPGLETHSAGAGGEGGGGRSVPRRTPGAAPPLRLFLDGRLRVCSLDEERFHEALVHPAMAGGSRARVLILGGGDGLALREVLGYQEVRSVTVVARDPQLVSLARTDPGLSRLNGGAFGDPRVQVRTGDVFGWLRERAPGRGGAFDVIISALPDPGISESTKLYSREFYGLAERALTERGRLAVHAGALTSRPRDVWTVEATLRSAGLRTTPYAVDGRVSGYQAGPDHAMRGRGPRPRDWGLVLAARGKERPPVRLAAAGRAPRAAAVTSASLREAVEWARRERISGLPPSSLMHPRFLD